ncbi:MAG TPA: tetratricopeptide repeat protein [Verrucomicrobiae bacterium]
MFFKPSKSALRLLALFLISASSVFVHAEEKTVSPPFVVVLERAQGGDILSQLIVGTMYEERGSYTNAFRWYKEAAQKGDASGQFKLGLLHAQGAGVSRDLITAVKWFELSAKQGFPAAQYNLGVCWEKGLGTTNRSYVEALKWYQLAAEQGDAFSQKALGVFYEKGYGVKPDLAEAYKWYALASANGVIDGETLRKNLVAKFKPEELAAAQKRFSDYAAAQAANSTQPPPRLPVEVNAKAPTKAKTKDFLD